MIVIKPIGSRTKFWTSVEKITALNPKTQQTKNVLIIDKIASIFADSKELVIQYPLKALD